MGEKVSHSVAWLALLPFLFYSAHAAAAGPPKEGTANVHVLVFNTQGSRVQGPITIRKFESRGRNFASRFHDGFAEDIPFGDYVLSADIHSRDGAVRFVRIYQRQTTVVIESVVPGIDFAVDKWDLKGTVVGSLPIGKTCFVKLVGVFSTASFESSISNSGGFSFGGLTWGKYLLLVVSEDGILANRPISIPYSMTEPPLEVPIPSEL